MLAEYSTEPDCISYSSVTARLEAKTQRVSH